MRHPLLVEGRPNCARQSLATVASTLSAPRVAATSCCDPGRHANVITPCLLTPCLNVPNKRGATGPFWGVERDSQRIAKGAGGKGPRQKTSKSVKKCQKVFRHFSRRAKKVKNRQKVSKSFSTLFDKFRAAPFFRPFWGAPL